MRRVALLAAMLLAGFRYSPAQDQDFSKVQMKVTKVNGSVYMLEGAGGNIGASVGEDGIVIVDDQYAPLADKIRASITRSARPSSVMSACASRASASASAHCPETNSASALDSSGEATLILRC